MRVAVISDLHLGVGDRSDSLAFDTELAPEAGSSFRLHWRLRRLSGCARHRLPSCTSSTAWTACTSVLVPKSNRVRAQGTASAGFLQALCPVEEGLRKPGKDFRHAVLARRRPCRAGGHEKPEHRRQVAL
jgi:hypothetical protein